MIIQKVLLINDVDVSNEPRIYTCYGLGSCVGLFIEDRKNKICGGTHIPLPKRIEGCELEDAATLIASMLNQFTEKGSDLLTLRAKLAGGALLYSNSIDIGAQNVKTVLTNLIQKKVFIVAMDVGGRLARTVSYNSVSGELLVTNSNRSKLSI